MSPVSSSLTPNQWRYSIGLIALGLSATALSVTLFVSAHFKFNMGFLNQLGTKSATVIGCVGAYFTLLGLIILYCKQKRRVGIKTEEIPVRNEHRDTIRKIYYLDPISQNDHWRHRYLAEEEPQFLIHYTQEAASRMKNMPLDVHYAGLFTDEMQRSIQIALEYLRVVHPGITISNHHNPFITNPNSTTRAIKEQIKLTRPQQPVLFFTSQATPKEHNCCCVYGDHFKEDKICIVSTDGLNGTANNTVLLMKTIAHQYGHLLGIGHCLHIRCLMNGALNQEDLQNIPLTPCAVDTAKIAHRTGMTLLQQSRNLLNFFTTVNERFQTQMDFTNEIALLTQRIRSLS